MKQEDLMFCGKCGKKLEEQDSICSACGAPVVRASDGAGTSAHDGPQQYTYDTPAARAGSSAGGRPWIAEHVVNIFAALTILVTVFPVFVTAGLSLVLAPFMLMLNADMDFLIALLLCLLTIISGGSALVSVIFRIIAYFDAKKNIIERSNSKIVKSCVLIMTAALTNIPVVAISYYHYDQKDFTVVILIVAVILSIAVTVMSVVDTNRLRARSDQ